MESQSIDLNERLAKVRSRAIEVLGEEHFEYWLKTPKHALGNKIPLELASTRQGESPLILRH